MLDKLPKRLEKGFSMALLRPLRNWQSIKRLPPGADEGAIVIPIEVGPSEAVALIRQALEGAGADS